MNLKLAKTIISVAIFVLITLPVLTAAETESERITAVTKLTEDFSKAERFEGRPA